MEGSVELCEEEEVSCGVSTCVVEKKNLVYLVLFLFLACITRRDEAIIPGCYAAVAISY